MTATIPSFSPDAPTPDLVEALDDQGVIVIEGLVATGVIDQLLGDVAADLEREEPGGGDFFGHRVKRLAGLAARSPAFGPMAANPTLLGLADAVLGANCKTFQLQVSGVLQVWPGGERQPLHRDVGVYAPYVPTGAGHPEILLSVMFAGTDFTTENGATWFVPGSHAWDSERTALPEETTQAAMSRGSVAIWRGATLHGMGVNAADAPRTGIVSGYVVGWLRQEENQYLSCPPEVAAGLEPQLQQLLGYRTHGGILGWVEERDPDLLLQPAPRDAAVGDYLRQPLQ